MYEYKVYTGRGLSCLVQGIVETRISAEMGRKRVRRRGNIMLSLAQNNAYESLVCSIKAFEQEALCTSID